MDAPRRPDLSLAIIGGGPAGLMAAEHARAAGVEVEVYDRMGSVGRKLLIAGKGGLNLTHAEPFEAFVRRYRERRVEVEDWLRDFDAQALRDWARGLGVDTFVGTSGRVFPRDLKAAPLLRGWVRRLRAQGVRFHMQHRLSGIGPNPRGGFTLHFETPQGSRGVDVPAAILALGGGSWPQLGSDGRWVACLREQGADVAALRPANGGFECAWSEHLCSRFAGSPVKPVALRWWDAAGRAHQRQGEFVLTAQGLEGSLVYAASADLRDLIERDGSAHIELDLAPERRLEDIATALARPRKARSIGEHLRRRAQLDGVRAALLFECSDTDDRDDPLRLAARIKALPLRLLRARPIEEAISSAGGVRFESLDADLMLRTRPGLFCAGEMLDWEAPTGGYLLTACFASGRRAADRAVRWLRSMPGPG